MKKFISLLIGCSLALAGAALAQQPDEQASPSPKNKKGAAEKTTHAAEAKPGATTANPEAPAAKQRGATNAPAGSKAQKPEATPKSAKAAGTGTNVSGEPVGGAPNEPGAGKGRKARANQESATAPATGTDVSGQPAGVPTPGAKQQAGPHRKGMNAPAANAKASPSATTATATSTSAKPATATTSASAAPSVSTATQTSAQTGTTAAVKKADPQKVQQVKAQATQIKAQHATFRAQAKPAQVPTVTFQQNYTIQGSNQWQGSQYEVFRSYHPERHDRGWYGSRYNRVELIGGGYYYWNNGYWYPAWGYDSANEYYAYDAPIYVGHRAEPPDRVIADVQAELQQMGYYTGEVDGLLGPLTREALTAYQADQGLTATAVIDEPTLDSLGMG
jgi:hypothetical protein